MHVSPATPLVPDPLLVKPRTGPEHQEQPSRKPDEPIPPLRPTVQDRIDVIRRLLDLREV